MRRAVKNAENSAGSILRITGRRIRTPARCPAAPQIINSSAGCISTQGFPCSIRKPPKTAAKTRRIPRRASIRVAFIPYRPDSGKSAGAGDSLSRLSACPLLVVAAGADVRFVAFGVIGALSPAEPMSSAPVCFSRSLARPPTRSYRSGPRAGLCPPSPCPRSAWPRTPGSPSRPALR